MATDREKLYEYRLQIRRLSDLTREARHVAVALIDEGYNAESVRANLFEARRSLDRAAQGVGALMNDAPSSPDQQYERDLS